MQICVKVGLSFLYIPKYSRVACLKLAGGEMFKSSN